MVAIIIFNKGGRNESQFRVLKDWLDRKVRKQLNYTCLKIEGQELKMDYVNLSFEGFVSLLIFVFKVMS